MTNFIDFLNLPLLMVGIATAISIILGIIVYFSDKKNITNITFILFSLSAILWNISNYIFYQPYHSSILSLILLRLEIFFAIWYCFFLAKLFFVFPLKSIILPKLYHRLVIPFLIVISFITFTPFVFKSIDKFDISGRVASVINGFGIYIYGITILIVLCFGFYTLIIKLKKTNRRTVEREQFQYILIGAILTFSLHIIFNMVLPAFFNISQFTSLGSIFTLPFSILTSFAIIKYGLFDVKVIATELITYILWILLLIRTLTSVSSHDQIINGAILLATIIVGILLIKSVRKEVEQREKLETLKNELEKANSSLEEANVKLQSLDKLKTEFVSLASHQLRSPLTAIKGYTSMLLEGDYGEIIPSVKEIMDRILESSNNLTLVVEDLLNVAKIEQGGMKYQMDKFDFGELARNTVRDLSITAEKKGLKLIDISPIDQKYFVSGDKEKLRQVLINLIDNSMKYTPTGQIEVNLNYKDDKILLSIKDTGVGISKEIIGNLFAKFSRGDGAKLNSSGSGLGLYLVKEIVEAHHGRVWVESEGTGHGSTFFVKIDGVE
ncbi:MAG TPA: ATP-binding protein [Candidatus Paceibacterota bacterium]